MYINQTNTGENQTIVNNESGIVNINQEALYTSLVGDDTLKIYDEISQADQGKFVTGFVVACLLPGISLVADFMQVHPVINLPIWIYFLAFAIIFSVVIIGYYDNFKILTSKHPKDNECRQLYSDRLFDLIP